eukprot:15350648-Ditylum_brightwellii.AAC.1
MAQYGLYRSSNPAGANDSYAGSVVAVSADQGVMKFRSWMKKFAGGYIPFQGDTSMPPASRE